MHPLLYDLIYSLVFIFYVPIFLGKSLIKRKAFANLKDRLGLIHPKKKKNGKIIWIHAVSVGEFLSIRKLVELIEKKSPQTNIIISTITPPAYALAQKYLSSRCFICYFPFDWSFSVKKALHNINPDLIILMESEFWPNFLYFCKKCHKTVMTANGRVSEKAFKGYMKVQKFFKTRLEAISLFCMQSQSDADRLMQIGVEEKRIQVTGNMKFDSKPSENIEVLRAVEQWIGTCPSLLAGSTMKGEEELLLEIFNKLKMDFNTLKLIIAPRNPDRFDEVAQIIKDKGFALCRRTHKVITESDVFLLDTIGELPSLHKLASVVLVGGSIKPFGGHNVIEAAYYKKPIVIGEYMENFADIVSYFLKNEACVQTPFKGLYAALKKLFSAEELRKKLGENAYKVIEQNNGATNKVFYHINALLDARRSTLDS